MSVQMPSWPPVDQTAPDKDLESLTPGARKLDVQITNQPVMITFGVGYPAIYGQAERYQPVVGSIVRRFDAFKVRAATPKASLPAGATQAYVTLVAVQG